MSGMHPNQPDPSPYASPKAPPAAPLVPGEGDATGGLIPYKNSAALMAYYLGIFSLIPCLGILLGIPAFGLGIAGLRARSRNPAVKGSVHAWVGVVLGGGSVLMHVAVISLIILSARGQP